MAPFRHKPKPAPTCVVYAEHDSSSGWYLVSRFFLAKDKLATPSRGDSQTSTHDGESPLNTKTHQKLRKKLFEALPVKGDDFRTTMIQVYPQYLAIQWEPTGDVQTEQAQVQTLVIGILTKHFGWERPVIGRFGSREEHRAIEKKLGADWRIGS